jgi:hypothetical protein
MGSGAVRHKHTALRLQSGRHTNYQRQARGSSLCDYAVLYGQPWLFTVYQVAEVSAIRQARTDFDSPVDLKRDMCERHPAPTLPTSHDIIPASPSGKGLRYVAVSAYSVICAIADGHFP